MPKRNTLIAMAAILGAGLLFLVANLELPIVRNSFVYAKTAKNIIAHGFNPFPIIADPALFHGKPVGFSLLSVPLVLLFGVNAGMKVASFLGTALFLWAAYLFFQRMNRRAGIEPRFVPLELGLLFFNPLVFYQFWSAYPDSLFAGLVLLAFVLADVIVTQPERDTRAHILLLGLVIYAAILTRLYGLILGIAVPVYLLLHLRSFLKDSTIVRAKVTLLVLVFGVLGMALVLARLGGNPTLNFAVDFTLSGGGGYSAYLIALTDLSVELLISSIVIFVFALVLNFHFSLFFLLGGGASKSGSGAGWPVAPTCFGGLFLLGLLPFPGTDYNMRYFIPLFAFVVVAIVRGVLSTKRGLRRGVLGAYLGVASFLVLNYNLEPIYERFLSFNEEVMEPLLDRQRRLDNLRIGQHLDSSKEIGEINRAVEPEGVLYWVSAYYGTAKHGVVEELGIRDDIDVRYVRAIAEVPSTEKAVFLAYDYRGPGGLSELEDHFSITSLGSDLFRLVPLRVVLVRPERDHFDPGEPVALEARTSAFGVARVLRVEFLMNGQPIAVDTEPPYESVWQAAAEGRYVAAARVHDSKGNVALSAPRTLFVGIRALERAVAHSADDAEAVPGVFTFLTSDDLDLGEQALLIGLRFADIRLARGAKIRRAYVDFTVEEESQAKAELVIHAELTADARPFRESGRDISSRPTTAASVRWSPEPWRTFGERGEAQRTPDLSALVEEVVALPGWREGNALVLLISGSGERDAESYDSDPTAAPRLYVEVGAEGG